MQRTISAFILLLVCACNRTGIDGESRDPDISAAKPAEQDKVVADKDKINQPDGEAIALSAGDKGENEADRAVTQRIRQGLTRENAVSVSAKNVQISTTNGNVTLRGSVKTASEKLEIGRIAQGSEGATQVDNQLEVLEEVGR